MEAKKASTLWVRLMLVDCGKLGFLLLYWLFNVSSCEEQILLLQRIQHPRHHLVNRGQASLPGTHLWPLYLGFTIL